MAFQIEHAMAKTGEAFHCCFDAGDLQSVEMLHAIAETCRLTPNVSHWLPIREAAIVKAYPAKHGREPSS